MKKILLTAILLAGTLSAHAAEPFAGLYRQGSVDSISQLLLLDDQKFCFALMAGNLDIITGGTWQKTSEHNHKITLQLREQRNGVPLLAMNISSKFRPNTSKRMLHLSPPFQEKVWDDANLLLAFSKTADTPTQFKYAYSDKGGTPMSVQIAMPPDTRYVFAALPKTRKLFRFAIGKSRFVWLIANPQAVRETIDLDLTFDRQTNTLTAENETFGQPEKIPPEQQQTAWQQCHPQTPKTVRAADSKTEAILVPNAEIEFDPKQVKTTSDVWMNERP